MEAGVGLEGEDDDGEGGDGGVGLRGIEVDDDDGGGCGGEASLTTGLLSGPSV